MIREEVRLEEMAALVPLDPSFPFQERVAANRH